MPECEYCGKEHDGTYGSGRFCSRACHSGFATKANRKEISEKVSKALTIARKTRCRTCKATFYPKRKGRIYCSVRCKARDTKKETKKKLSERAKETVRNGTHQGFETRKIPSYAEKFFAEVLKRNNISYQSAHRMKNASGPDYLMDFYIEALKINLEICGKQHYYSAQVEINRDRDSSLKKYGVHVHRVRWKNPRTEEGLAHIREEIENFLILYRKMDAWHNRSRGNIDSEMR